MTQEVMLSLVDKVPKMNSSVRGGWKSVDAKSIVKLLPSALAVILILSAFYSLPALAQIVPVLEYTELWTEDDVSPTEPILVSDIYAADLDGDGAIEIISIGDAAGHAELRIGSWNGEDFTLLKEEEWQIEADFDTFGKAVYCSDVDDDRIVEILTSTKSHSTPFKGELKIWNWDRETNTLNVEGSRLWEGAYVKDIAAMDVDGDGIVEIVTVGDAGFPINAQLRVLSWDGLTLTEEHVENWQVDSGFTAADGVGFLGDVDGDGVIEIATAASTSDMIDLRVWRWDGAGMTLEASEQWKTMDDSSAKGLAVGDLDGDGLMEMVTAGTAASITLQNPLFGLITVWEWNGASLDLVAHEEWQSSRGNVEFFDTDVEDVDGDGFDEAIVAGALHETPCMNVFRVYNWDGEVLEGGHSEEWIGPGMTTSFAYTTCSGDVDGDGVVEILTGGRGTLPDGINYGEIDIWGWRFEGLSPWEQELKRILGSMWDILMLKRWQTIRSPLPALAGLVIAGSPFVLPAVAGLVIAGVIAGSPFVLPAVAGLVITVFIVIAVTRMQRFKRIPPR